MSTTSKLHYSGMVPSRRYGATGLLTYPRRRRLHLHRTYVGKAPTKASCHKLVREMAAVVLLTASAAFLSTPHRGAIIAAPSGGAAPEPVLRAPPPAEDAGPTLPLLLQPEASLAIGCSLLLALVINRLFTEDLLNSQSRADLIATVAPILLTLKGLSDLDIKERDAEPVPLDGTEQSWVSDELPEPARRELNWAADSLFSSTRCSSLAVWRDGRTLLLRGTLPPAVAARPGEAVVPGPLLSKCLEKKSGAPEYLPSLQLLPGRVEFSYLPEATQSVLVLPMGAGGGAFVVGSDTQRSFKQDDVTWARALSARVGAQLAGVVA